MSENGVLNHPFRKGELLDLNCPSREILQHIASRWGILVLIALDRETLRFSELRKKISGISEKMLSQTLQTFEKDGFIHRTMLPVMPPHTEYRLTPLGLEVYEQVIHLSDWIELNLPRVLNAGKEA
ncbi:helix-turn-helix transcriptional regulator [Rouxiella badensis]|uniref:winged helix-turn-helix transcriptional regulator n=1 Tax=Rouxiella badensis TaxID=1646377 RepID=UPI001D1361F7|nr:helix-turn-helix domain-containing protein [Rouxiella badensis]MCC3735195.1 helix-turn-helix transcriptional regulator [Rouxiella badensis]MCC3760492.1 helix-turn-helix transcriptional regulator [Rouxiella badensis]